MPLRLYSAILTDMGDFPRKPEKVYTHANSPKQAVRNFCNRYPYPPYVIEQVTDERMGAVYEREELFP